MKRVITYGTFDLLHYRHINLLEGESALGGYLVVALLVRLTAESFR